MSDKYLVLEVYRVKNGWCAEGTINATNGNKYHSKVEVHAITRGDVAGSEEPEREEAVKQLLDQLIDLIENPLLQEVLPTSVKVTLKAIKGTRKLIEKHREGSTAAGFNLGNLQHKIENPIICGALRAQRLYGR
jgi:hypothetical protein